MDGGDMQTFFFCLNSKSSLYLNQSQILIRSLCTMMREVLLYSCSKKIQDLLVGFNILFFLSLYVLYPGHLFHTIHKSYTCRHIHTVFGEMASEIKILVMCMDILFGKFIYSCPRYCTVFYVYYF